MARHKTNKLRVAAHDLSEVIAILAHTSKKTKSTSGRTPSATSSQQEGRGASTVASNEHFRNGTESVQGASKKATRLVTLCARRFRFAGDWPRVPTEVCFREGYE